MSKSPQDQILHLASQYLQTNDIRLSHLKGDGSDRQIFLASKKQDPGEGIVGVFHLNKQENADFIYLSQKMKQVGIPVPGVYLHDQNENAYLVQYLGDSNLGECIDRWTDEGTKKNIEKAYLKVLPYLVKMQKELTPKILQFLSNRKMSQKEFGEDLAYFERDFIKRFEYQPFFSSVVKQELNTELLVKLADLEATVFVYRDFQSRNIMWWQERPRFIDYQSAFLGTIYYDLASLLYASKSGLNEQTRDVLLKNFYQLADLQIDYTDFRRNFYRFVLIRRLRSLGSYGYLAMEKGKKEFLSSIDPTLVELEFLLTEKEELQQFPATLEMISRIRESRNS